MIKPDRWLHLHAQRLGINPRLINPASVDLSVGPEVVVITPGSTTRVKLQWNAAFTLRPGATYLLHSQETTSIPSGQCAQLIPKSSSSRRGLGINVGWGDPGFTGQWTFAVTPAKATDIRLGDRLTQLVFMDLDGPADATYDQTGRYQHSAGVQEARE